MKGKNKTTPRHAKRENGRRVGEKMRQMLSARMKVGGERSERRVPPSHASQLLLRTDHGLDT
jgi:hypothetical protein